MTRWGFQESYNNLISTLDLQNESEIGNSRSIVIGLSEVKGW